jgi:hypothetical protein
MEMGKMKKASKGFSGSSWQLTALIFCKDPSLLLVLIGRHIDCKNGMFWMWKHIQVFFFFTDFEVSFLLHVSNSAYIQENNETAWLILLFFL